MDTRQRTVFVYPVVYPNDVTLILIVSSIGEVCIWVTDKEIDKYIYMPNLSAIQNLFKDTLMNTELPPMHGLLGGCTYYVVGVLHGWVLFSSHPVH